MAEIISFVYDKIIVKKKRKWFNNWLLQQRTHMNLLQELCTSESTDCKNYLRIDIDAFKNKIQLREVISAEGRIIVTLTVSVSNRFDKSKPQMQSVVHQGWLFNKFFTGQTPYYYRVVRLTERQCQRLCNYQLDGRKYLCCTICRAAICLVRGRLIYASAYIIAF